MRFIFKIYFSEIDFLILYFYPPYGWWVDGLGFFVIISLCEWVCVCDIVGVAFRMDWTGADERVYNGQTGGVKIGTTHNHLLNDNNFDFVTHLEKPRSET